MIVFGIVLLLIGWLTGLGILYTLGEILLVIGLILLLLGHFGGPDRTYAGRRYWY
jgi:hypothetical protein